MVDEALGVVSIEGQSIFGSRNGLITSRATSINRARHGHPIDRNNGTTRIARNPRGRGTARCVRAFRLRTDRDFIQRCRRRRADRHRDRESRPMCACSHSIRVAYIPKPTDSSSASASTTTSQIEMLLPDAHDVQDLVTRKGLFSFYRDGHQECCAIRKIKPSAPTSCGPGCVDHGATPRSEPDPH